MQENELIVRLKAGDERAFEALVSGYQDRVYNTVLGFVQNENDAEEITQDVFIKVIQKVKDFQSQSTLSTWIYRIAVNHALDSVKKNQASKRQGWLNRLLGRDLENAAFEFHHPGVALEKKEDAAILFRLIRQLPEKQQTAFVLQKLEGLSQQEIAAVMKTTVSAVESLLIRAKTNLKQFYVSGITG